MSLLPCNLKLDSLVAFVPLPDGLGNNWLNTGHYRHPQVIQN